MTASNSCIYAGQVVHQRFAPKRHRLQYRLFQLLFDLDELDALGGRLKLFSHNKWNLFSFFDRDHSGTEVGLRSYVESLLATAGLPRPVGQISLLCVPRIFGFAFNPISIFYCHDRVGNLTTIMYEVNNTFGENHTYIIPFSGSPEGNIEQECGKDFYVSPFMDMQMDYQFRLNSPGQNVVVRIDAVSPDKVKMIHAAFRGARRELTDRALARLIWEYPLMTVGVVVAIHWEAVKLFLKGLRLRRREPVGRRGVSVVRAA